MSWYIGATTHHKEILMTINNIPLVHPKFCFVPIFKSTTERRQGLVFLIRVWDILLSYFCTKPLLSSPLNSERKKAVCSIVIKRKWKERTAPHIHSARIGLGWDKRIDKRTDFYQRPIALEETKEGAVSIFVSLFRTNVPKMHKCRK